MVKVTHHVELVVFQIPMRGNEIIADMGAFMMHRAFQIPMRGNEHLVDNEYGVLDTGRFKSP